MKSKNKRKAGDAKMAAAKTSIFKQKAYRELVALGAFMAMVFLALALWSYSPHDPSFNTVVQGEQLLENQAGLLGSYTADVFMQAFGFASYVLLFLGIVFAIYFVWVEVCQDLFIKFLGAVLFTSGLASILTLLDKEVSHPNSWGGALGFYIMAYCQPFLGMGVYLLIFLCVAGGLAMMFKLSLQGLFQTTVKGTLVGTAKATVWSKDAVVSAVSNAIPRSFMGKRPATDQLKDRDRKLKNILAESDAKNLKVKKARANALLESSLDPLDDIPIVVKRTQEPVALQSVKKTSTALTSAEDKQYDLPKITLLDEREAQEIEVNKEELLANARILEEKLANFGVKGRVVEVQPGPVVTMYEFEPAAGVKVAQITRLDNDLTLALKALSVRITMLPGKSVVGVEVANQNRHIVYFRDVLSEGGFFNEESLLTMTLGKDISGAPYVANLRKMPHLLVAGATGAGKSVAINSMISSILYKATPEQVRMILVDPKMLELSMYDEIPHLLLPVVTDPRKASAALRWAVSEMEQRYRLMADLGVRNIEGYNAKVKDVVKAREEEEAEKLDRPDMPDMEYRQESLGEASSKVRQDHKGSMPFIVIVIDELADLMMVAGRDVEESIIRLAQMARAAGIHLILATQRPSVDVITGVIKANMPSRISFQVSSKIDSRTILDANGAELLLGAGDMLYMPPGTSKLLRIHGAFISDEEVDRVTTFWKNQAKPNYQEEILRSTEEAAQETEETGDPDEDLYQKALGLVLDHGTASISMIQRRLRIGYNRAARLVERMDDEGLLVPGEPGKPRELRSRVGM